MATDGLKPWQRRRVAPVPKPTSKLGRWMRAGAIWLVLLFVGGVLQGFFLEPPLQQRLCRLDQLTSLCLRVGWGDLPTDAMRRDFASAQARGTRVALNAFRDKYPNGPMDPDAERALARCRPAETWIARDMPAIPIRVTHPLAPDAAAATNALAAEQAALACQGYGGGEYRLVAARADGAITSCRSAGGRQTCGWRGVAVCSVEQKAVVERCPPA